MSEIKKTSPGDQTKIDVDIDDQFSRKLSWNSSEWPSISPGWLWKNPRESLTKMIGHIRLRLGQQTNNIIEIDTWVNR